MEYIGKFLEIFSNKHLIPTILAFVLMVIINLLMPENYWMINKIDLEMFRLFVFGICFVFIQFLIWLYRFSNKKYVIKKQKENKKKKEIENLNRNVESYRKKADEMNPEMRNLIIKLIKTSNKPIEYTTMQVRRLISEYDEILFFYKTSNSNGRELIKLNENTYNMYSYIYKQYGKIGNF